MSAVEGQFARHTKTDKHPHTNMAKASLNMMTLTSAPDYAASGILMNAVDSGWVTDEVKADNPFAYWPFDEPTGPLLDRVGQRRLETEGRVERVPGVSGGAVQFVAPEHSQERYAGGDGATGYSISITKDRSASKFG